MFFFASLCPLMFVTFSFNGQQQMILFSSLFPLLHKTPFPSECILAFPPSVRFPLLLLSPEIPHPRPKPPMAPPPPVLSATLLLLLLLLLAHVLPHNAASAAAGADSSPARNVNPFTAKAAFIRYWNRKVPNNRPHPSFFLAKLSPLRAADSASFPSTLPAIRARLPALCSKAALLCPTAANFSLASGPNPTGPFKGYSNGNFSNYGTGEVAGSDSFRNYSPDLNIAGDSFRRYGRDSSGRADTFTSYESDGNVVTANFTSYAGGSTAGSGSFSSYAAETNVPDSTFTSYDAQSNGRARSFASYSSEANHGESGFSGYGHGGNGVRETFSSYGNESNVLASAFSNYGQSGNGATDTFTGYGVEGNVPENTFRSYGAAGNAGVDSFKQYRDDANVGDDRFTSYAKGANGGAAEFQSYGRSANPGSTSFKGYGEGSNPNHRIGFKQYAGENTTFKGYAKSGGVSFKEYHNSSGSHEHVGKWSPEPGKFFRERELVAGNRMPMPDIRDRMPRRAFLPRSIAARIPFEAAAVAEAFGLGVGGLHGGDGTAAMGRAVAATVAECARKASKGETKLCATSAEDVVDFAVEMLGDDVVVRSTASAAGGGGEVVLGSVEGVDGGRVTRAVSCHQSLFPYLVYYCHSVPEVRVYEADILAAMAGDGGDSGEEKKKKINRGVAICHLDTSEWSPSHGAFVALGGKPGEVEVCHWIFQGDMTWTVAD